MEVERRAPLGPAPGPRGDPPRGRDADGALRASGRRVGALLPALAAASAGRSPGEGPVAGAGADRVEPVAISYADRFPAWGHRKIAMLMRVDGHHAPDSTVLRALKRTGRVLAGRLPGGAAAAGRGEAGGVRGAAFGAEPGLAARLQRVRDPPGGATKLTRIHRASDTPSRPSRPIPILLRTAETVECGIASVSAISAAVIRSCLSFAITASPIGT